MTGMRVLDTFSGIGGLSLGLEEAEMTTVAFCEIDPYCRRVLAKHWPGVPIHDDIRTFDGVPCDLIAGGPPCQRTSVAAAIQGKRTGETLWPEQRRLIERWRPRWALIEQPPGNKIWEAQVARDLERIGYHFSRLQRSARSCGAPHLRRRVFFVANPMRERCEEVARLLAAWPPDPDPWPAPPRGAWRTSGTGNRRVDDGLSPWVDRLRTLGNSVFPKNAEELGRAIMLAERMPAFA